MDRAKLLAFLQEEADRCPLCGTSEWEWDADPHSYHPMKKFCPGCHMVELARDSKDAQNGARVQLIPTDSPQYQAALDAEEAAYRAEVEERRAAKAEARGRPAGVDLLMAEPE